MICLAYCLTAMILMSMSAARSVATRLLHITGGRHVRAIPEKPPKAILICHGALYPEKRQVSINRCLNSHNRDREMPRYNFDSDPLAKCLNAIAAIGWIIMKNFYVDSITSLIALGYNPQ